MNKFVCVLGGVQLILREIFIHVNNNDVNKNRFLRIYLYFFSQIYCEECVSCSCIFVGPWMKSTSSSLFVKFSVVDAVTGSCNYCFTSYFEDFWRNICILSFNSQVMYFSGIALISLLNLLYLFKLNKNWQRYEATIFVNEKNDASMPGHDQKCIGTDQVFIHFLL